MENNYFIQILLALFGVIAQLASTVIAKKHLKKALTFVSIMTIAIAFLWAGTKLVLTIQSNSEASYACPDRLSNDITPGGDSSERITAPYNLKVIFRASPTINGRILAEVTWVHSDSRHVSTLIKISGRKGIPANSDLPVRADQPIPPEGMCGVWYRQVFDQTIAGGDTIDGLWANETYCFKINDSDEDGGNSPPYPSISTQPVCQKAEWSIAWGEPAVPPYE